MRSFLFKTLFGKPMKWFKLTGKQCFFIILILSIISIIPSVIYNYNFQIYVIGIGMVLAGCLIIRDKKYDRI